MLNGTITFAGKTAGDVRLALEALAAQMELAHIGESGDEKSGVLGTADHAARYDIAGTPDAFSDEDARAVVRHRDANGVHRLEADGYEVAMYRDPNSGDMRFDITTPGDRVDLGIEDVAVDVNDERVYP